VHLAEEDLKRSEDDFKWRYHSYWISQMGGEHTDIPAFMVNVHKIDSVPDAVAYYQQAQKKLDAVFDQVLVQLQKREELHVVTAQVYLQICDGKTIKKLHRGM